MSIRWKILIVLLVFSLTPLLVFVGVSQRGTRRLGETVSDVATLQLTQIVGKELQQTAQNHAKILRLEMNLLEVILKRLASEAERLLAQAPKPQPKIYLAEDFDGPTSAPTGKVNSAKYTRRISAVESEPLPISYEHQVFLLSPGTDERAVAPDIARLSSLLPLHKELQRERDDLIHWQRVSLAHGVHAVYPGHGNFSADYAPQNQPWFRLAKEGGKLVWSAPYQNPASGYLVMSASVPIRRLNGSFAGVAAIDVLISTMLQIDEPESQWSRHMRSFLVHLDVDRKRGATGFRVVAQKRPQPQSMAWSDTIGLERLDSSEKEKMQLILDDLENGQAGNLEMPYDDTAFIWAYAPVWEGLGLIHLVPQKMIALQIARTAKRIGRWQRLDTVIASSAVVLILTLIAFWRSRALIKSLMVMVEMVQRLAQGDFSARMDIKTGDERDLVANAFNEMVPKLEDRMQIRKALEVAQEVQQNLLPEKIPVLPGFEIAARSVYCDETGGDYYDFISDGEENRKRLGIAVGDVTGHGVGAALLMATSRALIRGLSTKRICLAERITEVNRLLTADIRQTGNFMSLFFLGLEEGSRTISWVRAGHDPAIVFDPAGQRFDTLSGPGVILGADEAYSFQQFEKTIKNPGTIILIGTDGIWEAHNSDGEMFGKQRLCAIVRNNYDRAPGKILNAVLDAITLFQRGTAQEDDITLVVIKVM